MKKIILSSAFILTLVSFMGCLDTDKKYKFTFTNDSSKTITVTPDSGESWSTFVLESRTANTLTLNQDTVKFYYTPKAGMTATYPSSGAILFSDSTASNPDSSNSEHSDVLIGESSDSE
jgi:hypothetical protein